MEITKLPPAKMVVWRLLLVRLWIIKGDVELLNKGLDGGCLFFLSAATFGTRCCLQSLIYTLTLWSSGLWRRMQCVHGLQEVMSLTPRFNLIAAPKYKQSVLLKCVTHCCCCLIFRRFPEFSTEHCQKKTDDCIHNCLKHLKTIYLYQQWKHNLANFF